jgi:hypothetical protein
MVGAALKRPSDGDVETMTCRGLLEDAAFWVEKVSPIKKMKLRESQVIQMLFLAE